MSIDQNPTMSNFVTPRQKVCEIGLSAAENLCSRKVDQSSPKSLMTCYTPMPLTLPNVVALQQKVSEISATEIFAPGSGPMPKLTKFGKHVSIGQTPNRAKFHGASAKMCEMCSPKQWTKVHQNTRWPSTHKFPLSCQISSCSVNRCTIVTKFLYTLQCFGASGETPVSKFTNLSGDV